MTNHKQEQAKKIDDAYWRAITNVPDIYTKGRVRFAAGLRELINQYATSAPQDPNMDEFYARISGSGDDVVYVNDILKLIEELEKL